MVVVAVVHGQLPQVFAREFTGAATTDPRVQLERLFPIAALALLARALRLYDDAVGVASRSPGIAACHGHHASAAQRLEA